MSFSNQALDTALSFFLGNTELYEKMDDVGKEFFLKYITDRNSSSVREAVTLHYLKYKKYDTKHGADGFDPVSNKQKEVKPRMIEGKKKSANSGNFNDMTLELIEKKNNFDVVCSLFHDNRLIYVVEFPFSVIKEKITKPVLNAKVGKRVVCHFTWKDYDSKKLVIHYLNKSLLDNAVSKNHKSMLLSRIKK